MYRNDSRLSVRSAGVKSDARRRVNEQDLEWADVIFVMEREHKKTIEERFAHLESPPIEVLDIPDDFQYLDPELQALIRGAVEPELDRFLSR